jgi:hypothetical protein
MYKIGGLSGEYCWETGGTLSLIIRKTEAVVRG